jgi:hypothetical protein
MQDEEKGPVPEDNPQKVKSSDKKKSKGTGRIHWVNGLSVEAALEKAPLIFELATGSPYSYVTSQTYNN